MEISLLWPDVSYIEMIAQTEQANTLIEEKCEVLASGRSMLLEHLQKCSFRDKLSSLNICVPHINEAEYKELKTALEHLRNKFHGLKISWFLTDDGHKSQKIQQAMGKSSLLNINFHLLPRHNSDENKRIQIQYCIARAFFGKNTQTDVVFDTGQLKKAIKICVDERRPIQVPEYFKSRRPGIEGFSREMKKLKKRIHQVAPTTLNVLISGETGSGKEGAAFFIHDLSHRREKKFMAINCSLFTESALVSELFGHARGAFTGAEKQRDGRIKNLGGGTLFLDELPEMPPKGQAMLLRFLEDGLILPLGADEPIKIKSDIRIIAAGQPELLEKNVRKDLLYRIEGVRLEIPALRNMTGDMMSIVYNHNYKKTDLLGNQYPISQRHEVEDYFKKNLPLFQKYRWPGNIREFLKYVDRRIEIGCDEEVQILDEITLKMNNKENIQTQSNFYEDFKRIISKHRNSLPTAESLKWNYTTVRRGVNMS